MVDAVTSSLIRKFLPERVNKLAVKNLSIGLQKIPILSRIIFIFVPRKSKAKGADYELHETSSSSSQRRLPNRAPLFLRRSLNLAFQSVNCFILSGRRVIMDVDPRYYDHIAVNDGDVQNIVLSYLVHNCYKETAESFTTCTGLKQHTDYLVDMEKRKRIYDFAVEGNALKAIELTEEVAHGLLEKNEDLHFDLLSLHFVELVCSRKCTEALEFAQVKLAPFGKLHKYVEKLEDFMALLAYEEPEKSPMFHLLSVDYRQRVAESLNRAILAHGNLPSYTPMERLIKQATVVRQSLSQELGKDGIQSFSLRDFLKS